MHFQSTRNPAVRKTLSEAIIAGLAPDGGLFVPDHLPHVHLSAFSPALSYPEFAAHLLHYFFEGDPLDDHLKTMCEEAFNFPIPLAYLNDDTYLLELFHGPTLSFKDVGAQFLAASMARLSSQQTTTVMVATSGDTGSAVASAFYRKPHIQVVILYPTGQITARQEHQITCWDTNVLALSVDGTFDDCQRLVKSAFADPWFQQHTHLSSANSINIGRLLPQIVYYAYSSMQFFASHRMAPGFVVPTGNLGNAMAGFYAKAMGFPIREIVLSTNANQVILDYVQTGEFHPRPSMHTLANAMDVGNPSNFERLMHLFPTFDAFKKHVQVVSVSDDDIKHTIQRVYQQDDAIICPHTATGCFARETLSDAPWIVCATADPCKFETIVDPLIGKPTPIAPPLQRLLDKPMHLTKIGHTLDDVKAQMNKLIIL